MNGIDMGSIYMRGIYWLASYPKSGNTWLRAFLRNLIDDAEQPADINDLSTGVIASSRAWLDAVLGFDTADLSAEEVDRLRPIVYEWIAQEEYLGYHKIHDAYRLTADGAPLVGSKATLGAVYIVRNPLDVAVSVAGHWSCGLDEAIERMGDSEWALGRSREKLSSQVRQRLLSWSAHVGSWTSAPLPCHVIRYEDMQMNAFATFSSVARFLHLSDNAERVKKAIRFSDFRELSRQEEAHGFRERPQRAERFFRRGSSGGWRETLTQSQVRRVIAAHHTTMRQHGYIDAAGEPI